MRTFGTDILHVARTLDHVDEHMWGSIVSLVKNYLLRELVIEVVEFLVATRVQTERGLGSYWHPGAIPWSSRLKVNGQYQGQVSYSFDQNVDMWVVAVGDGLLKNSRSYQDLLGNVQPSKIPAYVDTNRPPRRIKTSILLPMRVPYHEVGLLNLESPEHLRPSSHMHGELRHIADALAELYVKRTRGDGRDEAIEFLIEQEKLPLRDGRTLFLAYSSRADDQVVDTIKQLLKEKFDLNVIDWKADVKSGDINTQIWSNISKSTVCICYLSELDGRKAKFQDNSNVLFEAGVMYALTHNQTMTAWIPIRERDSPPLIFDIAAERMLFVRRDASGVNEQALRSDLFRRLRILGLLPKRSARKAGPAATPSRNSLAGIARNRKKTRGSTIPAIERE